MKKFILRKRNDSIVLVENQLYQNSRSDYKFVYCYNAYAGRMRMDYKVFKNGTLPTTKEESKKLLDFYFPDKNYKIVKDINEDIIKETI